MMEVEHLPRLAAALALGVIVGLERGWRLRTAEEGERVAGVRTFPLIGLAGGVTGLLALRFSDLVVPVALLGLLALLVLGYRFSVERQGDYGITTEVAAFLVFLLGVLAGTGEMLLAISGSVLTAMLLGFKPSLHHLLTRIDGPELRAILQLTLISAVILPLLPRSGFGPWDVLNPYELWLMVVLISAIGFAGHFAVRLAGPQRGVLLTGLFAGLASSTALTLTLSRAAREQRALQPVFAAAIITASTTMFPRMLLLVGAVAPDMLPGLYLPIALLTAMGLLASVVLIWLARDVAGNTINPPMQQPFELTTALQFAVLLAVVMVGAEALRQYAGEAGIYTIALVSGLTDVDAITLSLTRMTEDRLELDIAQQGVILAALANTAVKLGLGVVIGGRSMAWRLLPGLGVVILAGVFWLITG